MGADEIPDQTACYAPSDDVVAREIDGDILIVPIAAGIGDAEEELYGLSPTARAVWNRLDGKTTLQKITDELSSEYEGPSGRIAEDILGLINELLKRGLVVKTGSRPSSA